MGCGPILNMKTLYSLAALLVLIPSARAQLTQWTSTGASDIASMLLYASPVITDTNSYLPSDLRIAEWSDGFYNTTRVPPTVVLTTNGYGLNIGGLLDSTTTMAVDYVVPIPTGASAATFYVDLQRGTNVDATVSLDVSVCTVPGQPLASLVRSNFTATSSWQTFSLTVTSNQWLTTANYTMNLCVSISPSHWAFNDSGQCLARNTRLTFADGPYTSFKRLHLLPEHFFGNLETVVTNSSLEWTGVPRKRVSTYSKVRLLTDAQTIGVLYGSSYFDLQSFPVFVDNNFLTNISYTSVNSNASTYATITLNNPGFHYVDIYAGKAAVTAIGNSARGVGQPVALFLPVNASAMIAKPKFNRNIVFYGDSIVHAKNNLPLAWSSQLERYGLGIYLDTADGASLYGDCTPNATYELQRRPAQVVQKWSAVSPSDIWVEMGINDFVGATTATNNFVVNYSGLLDLIHDAMPGTRVIAQTMITNSTETRSSIALSTYRQYVRDVASTRTWVTVAEGTNLITALAQLSDGVHPNDAGNAIFLRAAKKYLEENQMLSAKTNLIPYTANINTVANNGNTNQLQFVNGKLTAIVPQ